MGQHMVEALQLKSPAFRDNGTIPEKYTCDGDDVNPPLQLYSPNPEVQSFALLMEDPDAPSGTFVHWLLWNIDTNTSDIEEGAVPASAVQGRNSGGGLGYMGPCPPRGEHRYYFRLYALDTYLALPEGASREEFERAMQGHILEQATLLGRYERSRKDFTKERTPQ